MPHKQLDLSVYEDRFFSPVEARPILLKFVSWRASRDDQGKDMRWEKHTANFIWATL